ncbi:MAG: CpaF family protein [Acidobacteriaceae bacterium]|nr:CpaF family protein [Acidobacteriaceae bacterium]MBV9294607.1 CpaF family protein [Acidobacteriaceae bacterium]MBV9764436.1 CpaF family protein [Acidobacteriaceae bacterium]
MLAADTVRNDARAGETARPLGTRDVSSPQYQELKFSIHRKLLDRINLEAVYSMPGERVRQEIRPSVAKLVNEEKTPLSLAEKDRLIEEVLDEVFGLGPLEPLLRDRTVSDILVTTPRLIYVERGGKLERTSIEFKDDAHLMRIIERVVSRVGRRIDESSPMVDARLPDGSRVNAVIPPLAVDGPLLSIRRFGSDPLQPADLLRNQSLTEGMLELVKACVRARLNIIISGGTGAGKTTFLNMLSGFIPSNERIVTIEDAAELQLRQTHVARLETRPANLEGKGAVVQRHLLINALRMRPDRIIVGEVRGEEALDMLQAMNTGHDGSLTTIHANSPRDAISRLEVMIGMASGNLSVRSIRQQVASAVDVFVQNSRLADGSRRVTYITECVGMEGELVTTQDIFVFERTGVNSEGRVTGRFRPTGVRPKFSERLKAAGIELPPHLFQNVVEVR